MTLAILAGALLSQERDFSEFKPGPLRAPHTGLICAMRVTSGLLGSVVGRDATGTTDDWPALGYGYTADCFGPFGQYTCALSRGHEFGGHNCDVERIRRDGRKQRPWIHIADRRLHGAGGSANSFDDYHHRDQRRRFIEEGDRGDCRHE
jgi:hypothetical protein